MDAASLKSPAMKTAGIVLIEDHALVRDLLAAVFKEDDALELVGEFGSVAEGVLQKSPVSVLLQKPLVIHHPALTGDPHE